MFQSSSFTTRPASRQAWNPRQRVWSKDSRKHVQTQCSRDAPRHGHYRTWRADRRLARSPAYLAKCCYSTSTARTCPFMELGSSWLPAYSRRTSGSGHVAPPREHRPRDGVARMPPPRGGDFCPSGGGVETEPPWSLSQSPQRFPECHTIARQCPRPAAHSSVHTFRLRHAPSHLPAEARHLFPQYHHHRRALSLSSGHLPAEETTWGQHRKTQAEPALPPNSLLPAEDAFTAPHLHLRLNRTCPPPPL